MSKPNTNAAVARQVLRASLLCLVAAALIPVTLPAEAASNLNLSKSNINRTGDGDAQEPSQATSVKGSKSNTSERVTHGDAGEETERSINLNSSKSNAARTGQAPGDETDATPAPQNGTIIKSKSNITNN